MDTDKSVLTVQVGRCTTTISKTDIAALYSDLPMAQKQARLRALRSQLGPALEQAFVEFLEHEASLRPLNEQQLMMLFDACSDASREPGELLAILYALAPANGRVGYRQVNFLADYLRLRVERFLHEQGHDASALRDHDHIFGSGGDFCKTIHASTTAAIVAAPLVTICKTGTKNVTSYHGSAQAMTELGYSHCDFDVSRLNEELTRYGFAFLPLSALGFPYSDALKAARGMLWHEALDLLLRHGIHSGQPGWQHIVRETKIPLDIFKIVSPNAQVLNPRHHSTGVCSLHMIPYVLGLYLHLNSQGMIIHNYDTIDEVVNASSDPIPGTPNNLLLHVREHDVRIAECAPEDLGFVRASLDAIKEEEDLGATNEDFWKIISGQERGPKRDFIVANAAVLLVAAGKVPDPEVSLIEQLAAGSRIIEALIDSQRSEHNFRQLLALRTA